MSYVIQLDFFLPKIVYEGSTKYSKDIKVVQIGNTKKLIVNGLVQSFNGNSKLASSRVWGAIAKNIARNVPNVNSILLLGMGAGTMLKILSKNLGKNIETTSVEIDEKIVEIAKKYFDIDKLVNNKIVIEDAFNFVHDPKKYTKNTCYDCIIVDTYLGSDYPENIQSDTFLEDLVKLANSNTFIIFNRVINKTDEKTLDFFKKKLEKYLAKVTIEKVKCPVVADNYLLFGYKINQNE